jgi:hypothetical protein
MTTVNFEPLTVAADAAYREVTRRERRGGYS